MLKSYIEQLNENTKEYYSILSEDFPQFLSDYIYTPEMQKLEGINQIKILLPYIISWDEIW